MCSGSQYIQVANGAQCHTACRPGTFSAELYVCSFHPVPLLRVVEPRISDKSSMQLQLRPFLICLWNMAQPREDVHTLLSSAVVVAGLH